MNRPLKNINRAHAFLSNDLKWWKWILIFFFYFWPIALLKFIFGGDDEPAAAAITSRFILFGWFVLLYYACRTEKKSLKQIWPWLTLALIWILLGMPLGGGIYGDY